MFSIFLQKNKVVLLTVVIASVVTAGASLSYFSTKNKSVASDQKIEALQKSIEDLRVKNEQSAKVEEPEKKAIEVIQQVETPKIATQKTVPNNKVTEIVPVKAKLEDAPEEEPLVKCLSFDGSIAKLSKDDCEILKQANAVFEKIVNQYNSCMSKAKERLMDRLGTGDAIANDVYNATVTGCTVEKNNQVNTFQKNFKK